jgi:SAM-dependent methyltransferase
VRRVVAHELMDDPAVDRAELAANFDDIEFVNRSFGGIASIASALRQVRVRRLLDVGCGSGDVARALLARARAQNRPLDIVALDASETVLAIARERSAAEPALSFVLGDAVELPFADAAFDVATCNLAPSLRAGGSGEGAFRITPGGARDADRERSRTFADRLCGGRALRTFRRAQPSNQERCSPIREARVYRPRSRSSRAPRRLAASGRAPHGVLPVAARRPCLTSSSSAAAPPAPPARCRSRGAGSA